MNVRIHAACRFLLSSVLLLSAGASAQSAPVPLPTSIVYHNLQYGFCFLLPADWKGYTIVVDQWSGSVLDKPQKESGPQLLIRHPKWTKADPWQDIPIMIFTPSQWKLVAADNLAVSAAPIGPAELGLNESYIFALPPRWIGFYDAKGIDEVQTLMNQNPFQAPCGHKGHATRREPSLEPVNYSGAAMRGRAQDTTDIEAGISIETVVPRPGFETTSNRAWLP
ncbi:MAG: hypothetical protein WBP90_08130 [Terracidiphilus sp.]